MKRRHAAGLRSTDNAEELQKEQEQELMTLEQDHQNNLAAIGYEAIQKTYENGLVDLTQRALMG